MGRLTTACIGLSAIFGAVAATEAFAETVGDVIFFSTTCGVGSGIVTLGLTTTISDLLDGYDDEFWGKTTALTCCFFLGAQALFPDTMNDFYNTKLDKTPQARLTIDQPSNKIEEFVNTHKLRLTLG